MRFDIMRYREPYIIGIACRSKGIDIACRRKNLFGVERPLLLGGRLNNVDICPKQSVQRQRGMLAQRLRLVRGAPEQQRGRQCCRKRQRRQSHGRALLVIAGIEERVPVVEREP